MFDLKDMLTPVHCTITEQTPLQQVILTMKEKKWNVIPITDEEGRLKGVFTRSQLLAMILNQETLSSPITSYIKEAVTLSIDTPYEVVEKIVQKSKVGTGVVVDQHNKVLGLFTKTDMVMALLQASTSLKEQLETILKSSQLGVVMTDEMGRVIFVNDRFCQMKGTAKEKLLSTPLTDMFPSVSLPVKETAFIPKVVVGQVQTMLKLSHYHTVRGNQGVIALFQEASEVELMAQELHTVKMLKQTLDTAIEHAYDGILMVNHNQKVTLVSPALLDFFDLKREDVLYQSIDAVIPQLHLSTVFQTGEADLSDFMEMKGIKFIVHRIPIIQDQVVIGAIGKVMYRQLNEVSALFKKLEKAERKAAYYQNQLKKSETARFTWDDIMSLDGVVEKIKKSAAKAAKGRSTVLIRGESGTGKELFAHAIHNSSVRRKGRFIVVNCAAIPEDLLESEFFGYEAGAFTGAKSKGQIGKFDLANGGTLFLDEIGDMSLMLQAKLLRVIQEREFYRIGGNERIHVDVRIIAATNRNLEEMVEQGEFREDLYYRLNVISLHIPPLRERMKDIELLSEAFMNELNRLLGTSITGIEDQAKFILMNYRWPGNVRELKNILERAMTFSEYGKIQVDDLPEYMKEKVQKTLFERPVPLKLVTEDEQLVIQKALRSTEGNKTKAAKILGISRSGLYEKLKKFNLNH